MSEAGLLRSHRLNCESKKSFPSLQVADNYATLLEWAYPDDERRCGMEGYRCTACGEYHIGHPLPGVVIRSRHDTGRDPRSEAGPEATPDEAHSLGDGYRERRAS